jgi:hypothetical protein
LREPAKTKDIKEYFKKIYPKTSDTDLSDFAEAFVDNHKKKMYLANRFPNLKYDEIELLSDIVTDEDIKQYEKDFGN